MLAELALAWGTQDLLAGLPPWASAEAVALASQARSRSHRVASFRAMVPTPDGVRLATDCFLPQGSAQAPTIVARLPLGDHPWHRAYAELLGHLWASRGYAVVVQRTRGKPGSTGVHLPMGHELADGQSTLVWLRRQAWFDGRFATFGGSAFGYNQWAFTGAPELKAQLIQIANAEPEALLRPGGAFALASALHWARSDGPLLQAWPEARDLAPGFRPGLPAAEAAAACGAPEATFRDWALQPSGGPFWQGLDLRPRIALAQAPVLMLAGWHDPYLPGQLADWAALRRHPAPTVREGSRLVIGPWAHARELSWPGAQAPAGYRLASLACALPWFDAHLPPQGVAPAKAPEARVQAFLRGQEAWLPLAEWPPASAATLPGLAPTAPSRWQAWRLAWPSPEAPLKGQLLPPGEALPPSQPPPRTGFRLAHDPARPVVVSGGAALGDFAGLPPQGPWPSDGRALLLTGPPLTQAMVLADAPQLSLRLRAEGGPEAELFARLLWVGPQGQSHPLADGVRRLRFRPGQSQALELALAPCFVRLPQGSRLSLLLSASAFPLFAVHPNHPPLAPEAATPGRPLALHLDGQAGAHLKLRSWVLTEAPEAPNISTSNQWRRRAPKETQR